MKRPIIYVTLGYILGIIWGLYCKISIVFLYLFIILVYLISKIIFKSKKKFKLISFKRYFRYIKLIFNKYAIILIAIVSIISNLIVIHQNKRYEILYINLVDEINVVGTIISEKKEKSYKYIYKIKVEYINGNKNFENTCLILNINKKITTTVEYGDKVEINGVFKEPNSQTNYKGFDYKEYLKTIKTYGTLETKSLKVLKKNNLSFISIISNKLLKNIKNNVIEILPNEEGDILIGILFGDTSSIEDNIKETFKISNISHILAVSGMHISYIIIGLTYVFKYFGKKTSYVLISIFLLIYIVVTNFAPSVVRASIMALIMLFSKVFYKKNDIWTSMSVSILILLIYNPFLVKNLSVQFSYGGTIGIILFQKNILSIINNFKKQNRRKMRIKNYKHKYIGKIIGKIKEILSVNISAQIIITPIMIVNFNSFGPYFLIANLVVSFIIGPIVILGSILVIFSFISISLSKIISVILVYLLQILITLSKSISEFKYSNIYLKTPTIITIIFYYIIIFIFNFLYNVYNTKSNKLTNTQIRVKNIVSLIKFKIIQYKKRVISIILIICIIFSVVKTIPQDLRIYFIDVGQGDSTLIKTPCNKIILIDGGGSLSNDFDVGERILLPYLLDRKISKLDYIFISHFDQDHVGRNIYNIKKFKSRKCNYL